MANSPGAVRARAAAAKTAVRAQKTKPVRLKSVQPGRGQPSKTQAAWLRRGLDQPGGKLPLFDANGQRVHTGTIKSCIQQGWAEPWFENPIKPDWLVCKLTDLGRALVAPQAGR